ncbi:hypothetical protein ELY25_00550 [Vreelandella populi]|uniref:Transposase n=1 Tax=Vreelandella populi TaxID=2498858 RepID=A0A3S0X249_9GAMM|nr:hypothetical protein ELY25_00550 [Halomonas populi]RUR46773.1 hypothetical protein ELY37_08210 [Halomonas populi]
MTGAIKEHEADVTVGYLCRKLDISSRTFYNWRSKYAGLEVNKAKHLRELEAYRWRWSKVAGKPHTRQPAQIAPELIHSAALT